jgi:hypothetical protein
MAKIKVTNIFTKQPHEYSLSPTIIGKAIPSLSNDSRESGWRPVFEVFANRSTGNEAEDNLRRFKSQARFENLIAALMIVAIALILVVGSMP